MKSKGSEKGKFVYYKRLSCVSSSSSPSSWIVIVNKRALPTPEISVGLKTERRFLWHQIKGRFNKMQTMFWSCKI